MPVRTFLALDIDADRQNRLAAIAAELAAVNDRVRPVAAENLHVTLSFLGDVEDDQLREICKAAAKVSASADGPFEYEIRGIQSVPPAGRLRMIWADVSDPAGRLGLLQQSVSEAMAALGFPPDRRGFRPHVTIARVKYIKDPSAVQKRVGELADEDFGRQNAEELTTYTSNLTPQGRVYTPQGRSKLGG